MVAIISLWVATKKDAKKCNTELLNLYSNIIFLIWRIRKYKYD